MDLLERKVKSGTATRCFFVPSATYVMYLLLNKLVSRGSEKYKRKEICCSDPLIWLEKYKRKAHNKRATPQY
jgi:hypothetical protein